MEQDPFLNYMACHFYFLPTMIHWQISPVGKFTGYSFGVNGSDKYTHIKPDASHCPLILYLFANVDVVVVRDYLRRKAP